MVRKGSSSFSKEEFHYILLLYILKFLHKKFNLANQNLNLQKFYHNLPDIFSFKVTSRRDESTVIQSAYGRSEYSKSEAMSKVLGEFLERYFTNFNNIKNSENSLQIIPMNHKSIPQTLFAHSPSYLKWQKHT